MKFITIAEFCSRYRISERTVWNWVKRGRLEAVRDAGGRILRLIDPQWPVLDASDDPDLLRRIAILKSSEVAALLGVLPGSVRKMASEGRLAAVWVGSQRRFSLSAVRKAIAQQALGGRKPRNSKERSAGIVRWARLQLSKSD